MAAHIWPNVLPVVIANAFLTFAFSLVALAVALVPRSRRRPGTADWGRMLAESRKLLFDEPAAAIAAGMRIVVTPPA